MFADTLLNDPVRQLKNNNIQTAIKVSKSLFRHLLNPSNLRQLKPLLRFANTNSTYRQF